MGSDVDGRGRSNGAADFSPIECVTGPSRRGTRSRDPWNSRCARPRRRPTRKGVTEPVRRPPYGWIVLLGVLSGAPYGLVNEALSVVWANAGVDVGRITAVTSD